MVLGNFGKTVPSLSVSHYLVPTDEPLGLWALRVLWHTSGLQSAGGDIIWDIGMVYNVDTCWWISFIIHLSSGLLFRYSLVRVSQSSFHAFCGRWGWDFHSSLERSSCWAICPRVTQAVTMSPAWMSSTLHGTRGKHCGAWAGQTRSMRWTLWHFNFQSLGCHLSERARWARERGQDGQVEACDFEFQIETLAYFGAFQGC